MARKDRTSLVTWTETGLKVQFVKKAELNDSSFDSGFPDGLYAIPREIKVPRYNVRKMHQYCLEYGIDTSELTDEQLRQFEI